jgi:hypothetical protein
MTLDGRALTSAAMLAIFTAMVVMALGFPSQAGFMPLLIGIPGLLFCAAQLIADLRRAPAGKTPVPGPADGADVPEAQDARETTRRELFMFLWLGIFTIGLLAFGFLYAGPVLVFLYLKLGERESWFTALFAGVGTWLVLWGMFVWLLELSLFEGFVTQRLLG